MSSPPDDTVDVSVILPVYNEVDHLATEIERTRTALDASTYSYEIVVVDDGSTDGSGEKLSAIHGIRVLRFGQNRGSGSARRYGTRAARGRVIVWTDVDLTYPNDRIPELVDALDGFDQVVGARTSEQGKWRALRVPAKWLIRRLASFATRTPIPDLNSGFRAFRADVGRQYLHMLPPGFSCVTTMTMAFLTNGYSINYVPIGYAARAGSSKFHWFRDTKRYISQVVRLVISYNPMRFFAPVGLVLMAVGIGKLAYDLVSKDFRVGSNTFLLIFASAQVLILGLLADLIVRSTKPRTEVEPAQL